MKVNPRRLPSRQDIANWFCKKHPNELKLIWPHSELHGDRCRLCWREIFRRVKYQRLEAANG